MKKSVIQLLEKISNILNEEVSELPEIRYSLAPLCIRFMKKGTGKIKLVKRHLEVSTPIVYQFPIH